MKAHYVYDWKERAWRWISGGQFYLAFYGDLFWYDHEYEMWRQY